MEETTQNTNESGNTPVDTGFGISNDLQAGNKIPFKPGIQKGMLVGVKAFSKTSKKGDAYDVLEFNFVSLDNIANYSKMEFAVDRAKDVNKNTQVKGGKEKAMNVRIKHIYEAYKKFPEAGLGHGATSWANYFELIAKSFNEGGVENTPIYKVEGKMVAVWLKFTYFNNELGFPYSPNFIELVKEGKETNLVVDIKFDQIKQVEAKASNNSSNDSTFGAPAGNDYDEFMSQ